MPTPRAAPCRPRSWSLSRAVSCRTSARHLTAAPLSAPRAAGGSRSTGMLVSVKDLVRLFRRIAVTIAGTVILAVGVVLLAAPGPGLVVIAVALAVFAVEYEWARRRLAAVRAKAQSAAIKTAGSRLATASAVLFGVGAI